MSKTYDLTADQRYCADFATTLERLLSCLSLEAGVKSNQLRDAMTQANNVLDEYQQAMDVEDAEIKAEMA